MKKLLLFLCCLSTMGCATKLTHPIAGQVDQDIVKTCKVEPNTARVAFFTGYIRMYGKDNTHNEAVDILVNDQKVGTIGNKDEYIVVDLPPGKYSFSWQLFSSITKTRPIKTELVLTDKDLVFLETNLALIETPSMAFGAIGALMTAGNIEFEASFINRYSKGKAITDGKKLVLRNTTLKNSLVQLKAN